MRRHHEESNARSGWGPFTSRQLTTIVCVAIFATVMVPTAAIAAIATFKSTTTTPAITATNSTSGANAKAVVGAATSTNGSPRWGVIGTAGGASGIGVQGAGSKYGVFSKGPLGIASGKSLSCVTACVPGGLLTSGSVAPASLSAAAKAVQHLASGETESGSWAIYGRDGVSGNVAAASAITFVRPVPGTVQIVDVHGIGPATHCPGAGQADTGFLCVYENSFFGNIGTNSIYLDGVGTLNIGAEVYATGAAAGTFFEGGVYTVKAP